MSTCGVCALEPAKYKCPLCELPYGSLPCYRAHQSTHQQIPTGDSSPAPNTSQAPPPPTQVASTSDLSLHLPPRPPPPASPFIALAASAELRALFTKYPTLQSQLQWIYSAMLPPDPTVENLETMLGSDFRRGGRGRGGRERLQSWTMERGDRDGLHRLRHAKESPGTLGEGVREFCALVAKLCGEVATETDGAQTAKQRVEVKGNEVTNVVGKLSGNTA